MFKDYCKPGGICKLTFLLLLGWSFVVAISLAWNFYNTKTQTLERARTEARRATVVRAAVSFMCLLPGLSGLSSKRCAEPCVWLLSIQAIVT